MGPHDNQTHQIDMRTRSKIVSITIAAIGLAVTVPIASAVPLSKGQRARHQQWLFEQDRFVQMRKKAPRRTDAHGSAYVKTPRKSVCRLFTVRANRQAQAKSTSLFARKGATRSLRPYFERKRGAPWFGRRR